MAKVRNTWDEMSGQRASQFASWYDGSVTIHFRGSSMRESPKTSSTTLHNICNTSSLADLYTVIAFHWLLFLAQEVKDRNPTMDSLLLHIINLAYSLGVHLQKIVWGHHANIGFVALETWQLDGDDNIEMIGVFDRTLVPWHEGQK